MENTDIIGASVDMADKADYLAEKPIDFSKSLVRTGKRAVAAGRNIHDYALGKRKEAVQNNLLGHNKNRFGISRHVDNAFGIQKTVFENVNAPVHLISADKSGLSSKGVKKPLRNIKPPKLRIKEMVKNIKIKELVSAKNSSDMLTTAGKAGFNAVTGTLGFIAKTIVAGAKAVFTAIFPSVASAVSIIFVFGLTVALLVAAEKIDNDLTNSFSIVSGTTAGANYETGKIDGVRLTEQGITTNAWYTSNNPFHPEYGMVPRKPYGMGNCTCYAWGRRGEITGTPPNLCTGNASSWYDYNVKNKIYAYGSVPKAGAVCCWKGGSKGSGHVAIVEEVNADGTFTISESSWTRFFFRVRTGMTVGSMNEGNLIFQGFIYLEPYD